MVCYWISFYCSLCFPHQDHIQWKWHQTLRTETLASRTCHHRRSPGTWSYPFWESPWACQWWSGASGSSSSCSHDYFRFHKLFHARNLPDLAYLNNLSWKNLSDHFRSQNPKKDCPLRLNSQLVCSLGAFFWLKCCLPACGGPSGCLERSMTKFQSVQSTVTFEASFLISVFAFWLKNELRFNCFKFGCESKPNLCFDKVH